MEIVYINKLVYIHIYIVDGGAYWSECGVIKRREIKDELFVNMTQMYTSLHLIYWLVQYLSSNIMSIFIHIRYCNELLMKINGMSLDVYRHYIIY